MKRLFIIAVLSIATQFVFAQTTSTVPPPPLQNDTTVYKDQPSSKDSGTVTFAEQMPFSPYDFNQYLQRNMTYPKSEKTANHQGVVYVSFVVEKDGSITNVFVKKSSGYAALDDEALRCLAAMPAWTPGAMNGKNVRVEVTQPVRFTLTKSTPKQK